MSNNNNNKHHTNKVHRSIINSKALYVYRVGEKEKDKIKEAAYIMPVNV